jgi:F0F1-type ATP synthase membrane subunit b/b'
VFERRAYSCLVPSYIFLNMDATLKALAALAVQAIPTVLFFIFLTHYLKRVYFLPVSKILEDRRKQTEGMRELAQRAHQAAEKKSSEFETAIQMVRSEILQENEARRRVWAEEEAKLVADARLTAEQHVAAAKHDIARELERAKSDIGASVDKLSSQIVDTLLKRRAA